MIDGFAYILALIAGVALFVAGCMFLVALPSPWGAIVGLAILGVVLLVVAGFLSDI